MSHERDVEFNRRYVKEVIRASGMKQREFARNHDIPFWFISGLLSKHTLPYAHNAMPYSHVFPLLRTSKGVYRNQTKKNSGNVVRQARLKKGYTMREVSEMLDINFMTLSKIENGEPYGHIPRDKVRLALEDLLDIEIPQNPRYLEEWQVYAILTSTKNTAYLAKEYNRTAKSIQDIRNGKSYKAIYNEVFGEK